MKKLVLASNNAGKLAEFSQLLRRLDIEVLAQQTFNIPDCDEPFATFVENALHKARHAAQHTGLPALADDSGICVPALGGAPGVHSARYAIGNSPVDVALPKDTQNNLKLLESLKHIVSREAYYYCVLVLVRHPQDPQPIIVDGIWWGTIAHEPQGEGGFGYDPYFYLDDFQCTVAQLDKTVKNAISHRGQAVKKLFEQLLPIK